jgi:hypothetical protein
MSALHEIVSLALYAGVSPTGAGVEVPLLYYYVTPNKRECMASMSSYWGGSDSGTVAVKLQESATTVDSDFTDVVGGAFTTIADATPAIVTEQIFFTLLSTSKYLRETSTLVAGVIGPAVAVNLWLVKREA